METPHVKHGATNPYALVKKPELLGEWLLRALLLSSVGLISMKLTCLSLEWHSS
jgi:hypothetical protein